MRYYYYIYIMLVRAVKRMSQTFRARLTSTLIILRESFSKI